MLVQGKYADAKIFSENIDSGVLEQVKTLLDQDFIEGARVRIMPDCHVGIGCVIGFTADLKDKVIPNIVGVDIGCGMLTVELGQIEIDLKNLDRIIHKHVPSGTKTHGHQLVEFEKLKTIKIYKQLRNIRRIENSIGTLGGGNHFIEIATGKDNNKFLVIHSGSRNLGLQIAKYYQNLAVDKCKGIDEHLAQKDALIKSYENLENKKGLNKALKKLDRDFKRKQPDYPKDLCYLEGQARDDYLHDMGIAQEYASLNRKTMANIILEQLFGKSLADFPYWQTIHNYIDLESNIIRKGAIRANKGEKVLIPLNMRDGSLIGVGKGNEDWNFSAPHGAGRIMSRSEAFKTLDLKDFKKEMDGIYSTSISRSTLDEAPGAYKPMEEIIAMIGDTVEVIDQIKPIYNFKAKE